MENEQVPVPVGQEEIVYEGNILAVVHQKMKVGEKTFTAEFARRAPGTRLIIISPDNKILLTEEHRREQHGVDIRLPGGKVFDTFAQYTAFLETDENIMAVATEAAKKEAREEVGLTITEIEHLETSSCGATIEWDLYYFLVTGYDEHPDGQELELGENISLRWTDLEEVKAMCLDKRIQEDRSAAVLLRYLHSREK